MIRPLVRRDVAASLPIFESAFVDYPSFVAMYPDERHRRWMIRGFMGATARDCVALGEVQGAFVDGALVGLACWLPPGGHPVPLRRDAMALPRLMLGLMWRPSTIRPSVDASLELERHHPEGGAHWYLAAVAVHPDMARRGVGSAMLTEMHERLDVAGQPAFLETTDPLNSAWYERMGYRVRRAAPAFRGGPLQYSQWRDARSVHENGAPDG